MNTFVEEVGNSVFAIETSIGNLKRQHDSMAMMPDSIYTINEIMEELNLAIENLKAKIIRQTHL